MWFHYEGKVENQTVRGNENMNYFVDFEATQGPGEIISVGCVDENGRRFYSLVKPHYMENLTDFISDLTGITKADLQNAPDIDKVFSEFYTWLDKDEKVDFFVYGNSDKIFLKNTLKYASDFYAQCALGLMRSNLHDFSKDVREHFMLDRDISLVKIVEYYRKEKVAQNHNALDDALCLREIYENMKKDTVLECPFPDYQINYNMLSCSDSGNGVAKMTIEAVKGNFYVHFPSYRKAADWILQFLMPKSACITDKTKSRVSNHIRMSIEKEETYFGFKWCLHN